MKRNAVLHVFVKRLKSIVTLLLIAFSFNLQAEKIDTVENHEFTLFLMRSAKPISWSSPAALSSSVIKSNIKQLFNSKKSLHVYGHAVYNFTSDVLEQDTIWMGITSGASFVEELKAVFQEKIGLGTLGIRFPSIVEGKKEIIPDVSLNARYTEARFIKFLLSKESASQIAEFLDYMYSSYEDQYWSPISYYSVAFWPLYDGEGSACTSICFACLESGGIDIGDQLRREWCMEEKIPMDVIGGRYNDNKKVGIFKLLSSKSWYQGEGVENEDYIPLQLYEVNYIMDWVNEQLDESDVHYYSLSDDVQIKGLLMDFRHVKPQQSLSEIMKPRNNPSSFIRYHFEHLEPNSTNNNQ